MGIFALHLYVFYVINMKVIGYEWENNRETPPREV